jgi:hypothetical protein
MVTSSPKKLQNSRMKGARGFREPVRSYSDESPGGLMTALTFGAAMSRRRLHQCDPIPEWIVNIDTNVAFKCLILAYIISRRFQPTD